MSKPDPSCRYCRGAGEIITYARSGYIGDPDTTTDRCGCTYEPMCERCADEADYSTLMACGCGRHYREAVTA